jgi:triosephosphate isomerase
MRKPFIAGNWKLHNTIPEALELIESLKTALKDVTDREIVVAPVFTALVPVAKALRGSNITLAAQNCYPAQTGAFTGEVSPSLLKDAGCNYVIVGHSERRQLLGETDVFINGKIRALAAEGLGAIFCIGETLEERETDRTLDVLQTQVTEGLREVPAEAMTRIVVAYEPIWAIGTGRTASEDQAEDAHAFIRGLLQGLFGPPVAQEVRIIYGGSVKPDNVDGLMAQEDIDGCLVGGASLKAADFSRIVQFARQ